MVKHIKIQRFILYFEYLTIHSPVNSRLGDKEALDYQLQLC